MGKATYLIILLATVAGPLIAMIFSRRLRLTRHAWERMLLVFVCVSIPFIVLDVLQHARGWWSYNPDLVFDARLFGLPLEEVAFFFAIPFSSLYLFSQIDKIPAFSKPIGIPQRLLASVGMLAAVILSIVESKERTVFDSVLCLAVITIGSLMISHYQIRRYDFIWFVSIAALFIIVNGLLTSLPVVRYDYAFGSELRLGSIPLADGLYNVSLLLTSLLVYRYHRAPAAHPSSRP